MRNERHASRRIFAYFHELHNVFDQRQAPCLTPAQCRRTVAAWPSSGFGRRGDMRRLGNDQISGRGLGACDRNGIIDGTGIGKGSGACRIVARCWRRRRGGRSGIAKGADLWRLGRRSGRARPVGETRRRFRQICQWRLVRAHRHSVGSGVGRGRLRRLQPDPAPTARGRRGGAGNEPGRRAVSKLHGRSARRGARRHAAARRHRCRRWVRRGSACPSATITSATVSSRSATRTAPISLGR